MRDNETRTEFKKIGDTVIYITNTGKFEATVGGKVLRRTSVSALEREMRKHTEPLKAFTAYHQRVERHKIVDAVKKDRWSGWEFIDTSNIRQRGTLYHHDDSIISALSDLYKEWNRAAAEFVKRESAILKKARELEPADFGKGKEKQDNDD